MDLDVPRNGSRIQLVHWIATNVTIGSRDNTTNASPLTIGNSPVPYLQPSPPVGDVPHSYNVVVFPQSANFSIPAKYSNLTNTRVPFNVSEFVRDTGLGAPIAGSYFQVQNLTGSATTSFPPARSPTSTPGSNDGPVESPGAAGQLSAGGALWFGLTTAVIAGAAAVLL